MIEFRETEFSEIKLDGKNLIVLRCYKQRAVEF